MYAYGLPADTPIAGDWTGNGASDIGVVRPTASGELEWILNSTGTGSYNSGDTVYYYGSNGDIPVVGDWNGAGKDEIGVVRQTASGELEWILNSTGTGSYNSGDTVYYFGSNGDIPVVGDWNGAGKDEIGVVRPGSNGALNWTLDTNGDGVFDAGDTMYSYGANGAHPIAGDWTASGRDEIGVYRPDPSQHTLLFTLDSNGNGVYDASDQVFTFGAPGDTVLIGKWPPPGQLLQAASGQTSPTALGPTLTATELAPIVTEATDLWMATGLDAQQVQDLQDLNVRVGTLPSGLLGYRVGETLTLSPTADGYGWFVDPTPADNSEFSVPTAYGLEAPSGSPAAGRMDLLTAVAHEEGHALGLPDLIPSLYPDDVMTGTLSPGIRRLPSAREAQAAVAGP